jgi:hypothetical protein
MFRGVANVWVPVEDVERALSFYKNTLASRSSSRTVPGPRSMPTGSTSGSTAGSPRGRTPAVDRS